MVTPTPPPSRGRLVEVVSAPLGFFVLALLIVEAYLAAILIGAQLDSPNKLAGMWAGVALFVLVVVLVFVLVWFKPENLTFGQDAHLRSRGILPGTAEPEPAPKKPKRKGPAKKSEAGSAENPGDPS